MHNIHIYFGNDDIKHISVNGELICAKEVQDLLKLLDDPDTGAVHITFLHANILCTNIVERLDSLQKFKACKVYVFKRYLYAYLSSLGIKCELTIRKSLDINMEMSKRVPEEDDFTEQKVLYFLESINLKYGYDYRGYQIESIMRRIRISMLRENIHSFSGFQCAALQSREIFEQLFLDFSINTTEFFRDPEVFYAIRTRILPYLDSYAHLKIWCVGCSNGKEAYSLAILLDELGLLNKAQIYATDINPYVIEEAKNGLFSIDDIDMDARKYADAGGTKKFVDYFVLKGNYIKVNKYLQEKILFFQHSLINSGILNEFQLILCRNVLIYFTPELQTKVLENFYHSIDFGGFLVLGKNEGMLLNSGYSFFSNYLLKEKIYRAIRV